MKKRIFVALSFFIAIISVSMVNAQTYPYCPPNGVGNIQPEYSGKIAGYDGWWSSNEMNYGGHKVRVWGLDPISTRDNQGRIIAGGDEQFILFVDGKPVGRCPSDNGENVYDLMRDEENNVVGTWWWHYEDRDRTNKEEHDEEKFDEFVYLYNWIDNVLTVLHYRDGVEDPNPEYQGPPPADPLSLPPPSSNMSRVDQSVWHPISGGVGGIVVSVDKFGLLAPYIGLASTIFVGAVATAVCVKRIMHRKEKQ